MTANHLITALACIGANVIIVVILHYTIFWWNKYVANPIKKWGYINEGHKAMIFLKYKLLDSIFLRCTKFERATDLYLPPRVAFIRRDAFDAREEDFYQALYMQSQFTI